MPNIYEGQARHGKIYVSGAGAPAQGTPIEMRRRRRRRPLSKRKTVAYAAA
jgi:hypothetical protein